ncbi:MAG: hypothetical protein HPY57_14270 [Ignavibacteria bacterium]|nr:hypothetical protein [Ignavibacteria bacterium]
MALEIKLSSLKKEKRVRYERNKKLRRILKKDVEPYFTDYDIIWEKYVNQIYWDLVYKKKKEKIFYLYERKYN